MSAAVITGTYPLPSGATAIERTSIRIAAALTRWATARAERRQWRDDEMRAAIQREQTRPGEPLKADHLLAQMGLPR